jgi:predicted dehydrogenase
MNKPTETIRVGIIGIGNMGNTHAKQISNGEVPGMELTAVADHIEAKASDYPNSKFFACGSELIQSDTIDAVIIASPHYSHTTLGIEALEAGLHVMVEKPLSVHKADCERLIAAHTNKDQIFAAMFNQRTDPKYVKLKELIDNGELGDIRRIQWTITDWFRTEFYYTSGGWRATWEGEGGGVLLNQCPHQIDLWQWLFGMPTEVRATCSIGRYHDIEVEDDVTAFMQYADGKTGVFITSTGENPGTNRLEIACERGRVVLEGNSIKWDRNETMTSAFSKSATSGFTRPSQWDVSIPFKDNGEQHLGILKNVALAIKGEAELIAPAAEGIHSVELANSMIFSGFNNVTVKLPINADSYEVLLQKNITESTHVKKVTKSTAPSADFATSF